jgi:RimJ/RimL family protein N-acetyltransferase
LRPLCIGDAGDFFALHSDPRVMRYWSHPPWTERAQAIARIEQLERDRANAEFYTWATTLDGADRMIGTISLFAISRGQFRGEVGYALAPALWGSGYATEGLRLAIDFAFDTIGLARLEADVDPRNTPSCRVVERAGFQREGLLRQRWHVAGEVTDSAIYGLLRDEYVAAT